MDYKTKLTTRPAGFLAFVPILFLILLYVFTRVHNSLAFPPFIDETLHINQSSEAYAGHFLIGAQTGRLFGYWWLAFFQLHDDGALWIARSATILFSTLSVATIYSLGWRFISPLAGFIASIIYVMSPLSLFFERLALIDPYVSTFGILAVWFSVRFAKSRLDRDAVFCGLALVGAIAAKATGVMLVVIPGLAFFLLMPTNHWRSILRGVVLAYGILAAIWVPFYLFLISRGWNYLSSATSTVVGTSNLTGLPERLLSNMQSLWQIDLIFLSPLLIALISIATLYILIRRWRLALFLVLVTLLPVVGLSAFATRLSSRYIIFHAPSLLLLLSCGLMVLMVDLKRKAAILSPLPIVFLALWGVLFALPFQLQLWSNPAASQIPPYDRIEYISADSAGFALDKVAGYLVDQTSQTGKPIHIIGLISNCLGLRLYIRSSTPLTVECPILNPNGDNQQELSQLINLRASAGDGNFDLWVASENLSYAKLEAITFSYQPMATFERPDNSTRIVLYKVLRPDVP